ncbi:MADF domain [Trinorchestia longiramus]|nr:MADF domain [Trinorchestia longiramus]
MRDLLPSITLDDVRKKINTLRSQYRREAKSFLAWKQSGGETHVYRPKLWCFTALEFLSEADVSGNHSIPPMDGENPDHHGLDMDQEETHGMYTMEDEIAMAQLAMEDGTGEEGFCADTHTAAGNRPLKKKARLDPTGELLRLAMSKIASPHNEPSTEDDDSRFGKVVADELRNMSASQKCFTKKVINEAIFLGSMGAMDPSAHVVNSGNANKIITSSMNG